LESNGDENIRGKRRSKNDIDGRVHNCKYCEKTYLSYPALYTHMKQKHSKGPDGEARAPPSSGRGRGRPRKNVSYQGLFFSLINELIPNQKNIFRRTKEEVGLLILFFGLKNIMRCFLRTNMETIVSKSIPFIKNFFSFHRRTKVCTLRLIYLRYLQKSMRVKKISHTTRQLLRMII